MKEQIQRLNKTPGTEVQQGVFQSGITQAPNMPFVQQTKKKSTGVLVVNSLQQLLGQGAKVAAEIKDNERKEQDVIDGIEYRASAIEQAGKDIQEIEQLPLYEREAAYRERLNTNVNTLKQQFSNKQISSTAFKTYVNTMANTYQPYSTKALTSMQQVIVDKNKSMVKQAMYDYSSYGELPVDTISKEYGMTRTEIGQNWLDSQVVKISADLQMNKISPLQAIKKLDNVHKSMASKENPNIWKNSDYVKTVVTAKKGMLTKLSTINTKQEKLLEDIQKEKEANYIIALSEAETQEEKDTIIAKAKSEALSGNGINFQNVVQIIESSNKKAYERPTEVQLEPTELEVLKFAARTSNEVDFKGVAELAISGYITPEEANELNTLVKERQSLMRTLGEKGQAQSYKKAMKLISTVTKQNAFNPDPKLKAITDNLTYTFMERITGGEDPYAVATELIKNEPELSKSIERGKMAALEDAPKQYMNREFGLVSLKKVDLEKKSLELRNSTDLDKLNTYKASLNTLKKKKQITFEAYTAAMLALEK